MSNKVTIIPHTQTSVSIDAAMETTLPQLNVGTSVLTEFSCVAIGDRQFVLSGGHIGGHSNPASVQDHSYTFTFSYPSEFTVTSNSIPKNVYQHASVFYKGSVILIGGKTFSDSAGTADPPIIDVTSLGGTAPPIAALPVPLSGALAAAVDDNIVVVGGTTKDFTMNRDAYILNATTRVGIRASIDLMPNTHLLNCPWLRTVAKF